MRVAAPRVDGGRACAKTSPGNSSEISLVEHTVLVEYPGVKSVSEFIKDKLNLKTLP